MSARYIGGLVYNPPGGWSGLFPSNSSLTFGYTSGIALGSTYTIECFINPVSVSQGYLFEMAQSNTGGFSYLVFYISSGQVGSAVRPSTSGTEYYSSAGAVVAGVWQHVALVNTAGTAQLYVNGIAVGATYSMPALSTTPVFCAIGQRANGFSPSGTYYNGYISNLRITTSAVYTSNFTPPTGALLPLANTKLLTCRYPTFVDGSTNAYSLTATSATVDTANPFPTSGLPTPALGNAGNGIYTMSQYANLLAANQWPAIDPYYKNVTLNLHGNAGTVLPFNTDASTNNFQVTQIGDARPSNYTPFIENGYWSNLFGTSNYLTIPNSTATDPGTGDFCVEAWVYHTASASTLDVYFAVYSGGVSFYRNASGKLEVAQDAVAALLTGATTVPINQWNHVAVTRSGTTLRLFLNGVQDASTTNSTNLVGGVGYIGGAFGPTFYLIGYLSNLRMVKGSAVYTSGFTPPTTPLTAISGTQLLTCQSNRFIDNSSNAFAITVNGAPSVNPLQPFTAPTGTSAYGSGYFDGTGDYLNSPNNNFASNNFTIEGWFYPTTIANLTNFWGMDNGSGSTPKIIMYINSSGNLTVDMGNAGTTQFPVSASASTYLRANTWNHIAVVRSGTGAGQFALYINGTSVSTGQLGTNISSITATFNIGYIGEAYGQMFSGYVSNFRIVNGTAVYTGNFTPSTTPLTAVTNTSLLTAQTNAPSQNNTFLDSSTNNFTITRNGNTTQGTFTPYIPNGYWSMYSATSGQYIQVADSTPLNLSGGSYTLECWVNPTGNYGGYNTLIAKRVTAGGATSWEMFLRVSDGVFSYYNGTQYNSSVTPTAGVWSHLAAVYDGTYINLYVNGTRVLQSAVGNTNTSAPITIANFDNAEPYYGYISNVRVTKGAALYTGSSFTVPTSPLTTTVSAGTVSLLTCQSNRFIDNSANAATVTVTGSPSIQRYVPFSPTSAYTTSVIGGSGYFDGSGDYLSVPSSGAVQFGSGDFTIECWAYMTGAAQQFFFAQWNSPNRSWGLLVRNSGTTLSFVYSTTGSNETSVDGTIAAQAGRWAHFAAVRNGNTLTTYMNGVSVASASMSGVTLYNATQAVEIGRNPEATSTWNFSGYMTDARIVKGTAVYTTAFTPPTAALTAVSGTSLLCNYTNAAIFDNAMMNDLETVGNAQISTSVKKYGSASMYFDGSGDWLFTPTTPNMVIPASSTFTMECWAYLTGAQNTFRMLVSEANGNSSRYLSINSAGIEAQFGGSSGTSVAANYTFTLNTWYHIALVRNGTTVAIYINGQAQSVSNSTQTNAFFDVGTGMYIGRWGGSPSYEWPGYIDDLRITKGVARYTGNFTPPTSQVQDQ